MTGIAFWMNSRILYHHSHLRGGDGEGRGEEKQRDNERGGEDEKRIGREEEERRGDLRK